MNAHQRKAELRRNMRIRCKEADPHYIVAASRRIQQAVVDLTVFSQARAIGCYMALPTEVQTRQILESAWKQGKRVCVPGYNEEQKRYEMTWLQPDTETQAGRWRIPEPSLHEQAGPMDVDLMIVPAVAYDPHGGRLGHGGGHFDRLLGAWSGIKIGIAFEFQMSDEVPMGSQDIPVDLVVTERCIYQPEGPQTY